MSYHLPSIPREKHESYFHITHTGRPGVLLYFFIVLYYYTLTYNVIYSCIILYHIRHINTPSLISAATSSLLFVRNNQSLVSYRSGIDKQGKKNVRGWITRSTYYPNETFRSSSVALTFHSLLATSFSPGLYSSGR